MDTNELKEKLPKQLAAQPEQIEEILQQQIALRNSLIDNLPCVAVVLKKGTREIVYANEAARKIGAVPGKTCYAICAQRKDPCPFCRAPELWKTGESKQIEVDYQGRHYDGRWINLNKDLYVHYIFDLTERKKAEDVLHKSEARYRLLAENVTDIIWVVDMDMRLVFISPSVARLLGYSVEEAINTAMEKVYTPASFGLATRTLEDELIHDKDRAPDRSRIMELELVRKDSTTVFVEGNFTFLRDEYGQPSEILTIVRDITERKKLEEELRRSGEKYKTLIENMYDIVFQMSPEGTIEYISPTIKEHYGYIPETLIGKNFAATTPVDEMPKALEALKRVLAGEEIRSLEIRQLDSRGNTVIMEIHLLPVKKDGRVIAVQGVMRDITVRRQTEEELYRHREYLEELVKERTLKLEDELTERTRAEEALRKSEERFSQIVQNAQEFIWEVDAKGLYTYASSALEDLLGYKPHEVVGKKYFYDFFIPEKREALKAAAFVVFSQKKTLNKFFNPNQHKDGKLIILETSGVPIVDKEGNLMGYRGVDVNVTERKKAEEALRHSAEYFRLLTENCLDIILIVDKKGTITYVTPSIERCCGYTPEEMIGKSSFSFIVPSDLPRAILDFGKAILTKETTISNSFRVRHKDGSERILEGFGKNLLDVPAIKGFVMNVRDITERKRAEEQLKKSEALLKIQFQNSPDLIMILDRDYKYITLNRILFGSCTVEELIGKDALQVLPSDVREMVKSKFDRCLAKGENQEFEHRVGEGTWARARVVPLKSDDGVIDRLLVIATDITERKKSEEVLKGSYAKLEEQKKLLENKNIAFQEIIKAIEAGKNALKDEVMANVNELIMPAVKKLRLKESDQKHVKLLEKNLEALVSSFGRKISDKMLKLTPKEIEICNMVKNNLSTKDISRLLNISCQTVEKHRRNIRNKLHITNKDINLTSYLHTL